jgi:hypothetical protein
VPDDGSVHFRGAGIVVSMQCCWHINHWHSRGDARLVPNLPIVDRRTAGGLD